MQTVEKIAAELNSVLGDAVSDLELADLVDRVVVHRSETGKDVSSYVLLPVEGAPGERVAVFQDGSYARWAPSDAVLDG